VSLKIVELDKLPFAMLNILTQQFYFYANNINLSNQQLYVKFKILKIKRLILIGDIKR